MEVPGTEARFHLSPAFREGPERCRADDLWRFMSEEEPQTPEQIAEDRDLPLEAVLEAIAYCQCDPPEIRQDWEEEEALERARILNDPTYYFPGIEEKRAQILAEEVARASQRT